MWFNLLGMAVKTGADVYKRKQETKSLIALAERNHAEKMSRGEITYQGKVMDNQNQGIKDEIVLFIVILPIVVISYSVFSGTPNAKERILKMAESFLFLHQDREDYELCQLIINNYPELRIKNC